MEIIQIICTITTLAQTSVFVISRIKNLGPPFRIIEYFIEIIERNNRKKAFDFSIVLKKSPTTKNMVGDT